MKSTIVSPRLGTGFCALLSVLLFGLPGGGCGGGEAVEPTTFSKLRSLPATLTGELAITAFSESTPALGNLVVDGDSVFVIADLETISEVGIRLAFGEEYRAIHSVTLEAAESRDPNIPRYRIVQIKASGSE